MRRVAGLGLSLLLLALPAAPALPALQVDIPARVLVISLDGARPDAILQAQTPHIQALARRGAATWQAQTVLPPATLPAHASMLTGLSVAGHGVTWNDNAPSRPILAAPTFLALAHQAGYRTAMVVGKEKLRQFNQEGVDDYTFIRNGDGGVADRVIALLEAGYQVIFAHFPNPDYFGHLSGWMSEQYLYELGVTDTRIGRVLSALEALGLAERTLIILTADHGGHGFAHGADIPEDRLVPWLVAGPGVVPGTALSGPVSVADTAATVLWALGLPLPEQAVGRPVCQAFGLEPAAGAGEHCRATPPAMPPGR